MGHYLRGKRYPAGAGKKRKAAVEWFRTIPLWLLVGLVIVLVSGYVALGIHTNSAELTARLLGQGLTERVIEKNNLEMTVAEQLTVDRRSLLDHLQMVKVGGELEYLESSPTGIALR